MKLASFEQVKTANQEQITKDTLRTQSAKESLNKINTELNDANAKFELVLANQRVQWTKEEEDYLATIKNLGEEIQALQKRRAILLIPIDTIKEEAYNLLKESERIKTEATLKSAECDERIALLSTKLDELSERETKANELEQKLTIRESNLVLKEEAHRKLQDTLREKWDDYFATLSTKEKDFADRRKEIELKEINLASREDSLVAKAQELKDQDRFIKSQRAALEAAIKEKSANTNTI